MGLCNTLIVIPARYGSSRLPGKPLAIIGGKPMIQHVYERAKKARFSDEVVVATDDERIFKTVESFDGHVVMTSADHESGTDRVAEVNTRYLAEFVLNLQGDIPFVEPEVLDQLIEGFRKTEPSSSMGTLMAAIATEEELRDPGVVKVVTNNKGEALYFSRQPIPYKHSENSEARYFKHQGIYIYRRDFLRIFTELSPSPLEKLEGLEQLRALENGFPIRVFETKKTSLEVNTAEDLKKVSTLAAQR